MIKLLQINSVATSGSTGHIVEDIGNLAISNGLDSYIAYGRKALASNSQLIRIGNRIDVLWHVFITRVFDLHGLASIISTRRFIKKIEQIRPNIIHLHNIHGYYLNYKILFRYLEKNKTPVIWTLHDCWSITGHCAYYSYSKCDKCHTSIGCKNCKIKRDYPSCYLFSNSSYNFKSKKKYFNLLANNQLTIVTPSKWLSDEIGKSYLRDYNRLVINNGIDLDIFKPITRKDLCEKVMILGVASVWDERKGLADFVKLSYLLKENEEIVLVGLNKKQIDSLPKDKNIYGIERTENRDQLVELYSKSLCFINPTYEDNFPTTNIESIACGTPVITYRTGGSPEILDSETGFIVNQGDLCAVRECIDKLRTSNIEEISKKCRKRAENLYNKNICFSEYIKLYQAIL